MIRRIHVKTGHKTPAKHLSGFDLQWEKKEDSRLSDLLDEAKKRESAAVQTVNSKGVWSVTAIKDIAQ